MNDELIRQCAREASEPQGDLIRRAAIDAIMRYHARAVAPLVEAANLFAAMDLTKTEIPHEFGLWVLGLRKALAPFQQEASDVAD